VIETRCGGITFAVGLGALGEQALAVDRKLLELKRAPQQSRRSDRTHTPCTAAAHGAPPRRRARRRWQPSRAG
jgi:hypothetical protein